MIQSDPAAFATDHAAKATAGKPGVLTPKQRERQKTQEQHASDISYLVQHTITCLSFDTVLLSALGPWLEKVQPLDQMKGLLKTGKFVPLDQLPAMPCDHEHGGGFLKKAWHWMKAEAYGDLGAVPITLVAQYAAPGAMQHLNNGMEKAFGGLYRWSAERSTASWAQEHDIAKDSEEYKAHAQQLYDEEVRHLAQAAVWTGTSVPINVFVQMHGAKTEFIALHGVPAWEKEVGRIAANVSIGKLAIGGLVMATVLGSRAVMPDTVHRIETAANENVVMPATKGAKYLLGIKEKKPVAPKENWQARVAEQDNEVAADKGAALATR